MKYRIIIDILGDCSVSVWDGDQRKNVDFTAKKAWTLFEYLYLNSDRWVSLEMIREALWGDVQISDLSNSVKVLVYVIRKNFDNVAPGLGKRILKQKYGSYYINKEDALLFECDAEIFEKEAVQALESNTIGDIERARKRYSGYVQITAKESRWQNMLKQKYQAYYRRLVSAEIDYLKKSDRREDALKTCREALLFSPEDRFFEGIYKGLVVEGGHGNSDRKIHSLQ
jgi:DNA-binding SARP family transcriptional activator